MIPHHSHWCPPNTPGQDMHATRKKSWGHHGILLTTKRCRCCPHLTVVKTVTWLVSNRVRVKFQGFWFQNQCSDPIYQTAFIISTSACNIVLIPISTCKIVFLPSVKVQYNSHVPHEVFLIKEACCWPQPTIVSLMFSKPSISYSL